MNIVATIIALAKSFVGNKEVSGNSGFKNADFEKLMKDVGWYKGAPWCAFFTKLIWQKAYAKTEFIKAVTRCANGGAMVTFTSFKENSGFKTGKIPKNGAIAIWQHGNSWQGHAGIVINATYAANTFQTVEGNTNISGSREGDSVAIKLRTTERPFKKDGLNLVGFIYPEEI